LIWHAHRLCILQASQRGRAQAAARREHCPTGTRWQGAGRWPFSVAEGSRSFPEVEGYVLAAEIAAVALAVGLVADEDAAATGVDLFESCVICQFPTPLLRGANIRPERLNLQHSVFS
jgi:hypothetical protein